MYQPCDSLVACPGRPLSAHSITDGIDSSLPTAFKDRWMHLKDGCSIHAVSLKFADDQKCSFTFIPNANIQTNIQTSLTHVLCTEPNLIQVYLKCNKASVIAARAH